MPKGNSGGVAVERTRGIPQFLQHYTPRNQTPIDMEAVRNVVQNIINKGILKFLEKKKTMLVDENPFSLVANVSIVVFDLHSLINQRRKIHEEMERRPRTLFRNVWVRKLEMGEGSSNAGAKRALPPTEKGIQRRALRFVVPLKVPPGNQWYKF